MGSVNAIICENDRSRTRGVAQPNVSSITVLQKILIDNYDKTKEQFDNLPTDEARQAFVNIFDDFTEEEFKQGAWRVQMLLNMIDTENEAKQICD